MSDVQGANGQDLVPPAVKRNAARAQELMDQQRALKKPPETPLVEATPPVVEPPAQSTPPVQPTLESNDTVEWKNRYESMKGRFEQSNVQVQKMANQIGDMQKLLAGLSAPAPAPAAAAKALLTPEERASYGDEMLDVVGRRAQEVYDPLVAELRAQIATLEKRVSGVSNVVQVNNKEAMLAELRKRFPNFDDINEDKRFIDWLGLPDAYSGAIRQNLLTRAFETFQTERVAAFINGFITDEATTSPEDARARAAGGAQPPKVSLEALAAPGRASGSGGQNPPAEKPTFTRAQISSFYNDVRAGVYTGKDAEKAAVEKAFFDAMAEGRIR